jgi:4-hydroxyphenylpyruvate dioxygenase-like putative hemolysin
MGHIVSNHERFQVQAFTTNFGTSCFFFETTEGRHYFAGYGHSRTTYEA